MRIPALSMFVLSSCLLLAAQTATHTPKQLLVSHPPSDVFVHARIYTGAGFSSDQPQIVEALAVDHGLIVAVGSSAEILAAAGPQTIVHDLAKLPAGATVFPGFNDAHTHLGDGGRMRLTIDLTGTPSLAAMLTTLESAANNAAAGQWLIGGNWDHTLWADPRLPSRADLDRVSHGHPVFLGCIDGHIAVVNSAALLAAKIDAHTQPPAGGAIDHDASGQPTGILRESAQQLVESALPPPTHAMRLAAAQLAIRDALSHGVTSVQDNSDWQDFLVYEELEQHDALDLRITEWLPFAAPLDELKAHRAAHPADDRMLHTGMLKGFMDGSLGSRTAALKAPYADDPGNRGLPQYTQQTLNQMALERAAAGFQLGFHAIGDAAAAMALDAFAQSASTPISRNARNRVEHAQVVDPADIARFASLGVVASMQPNHLLTDMRWAASRLGPERAAYSYAWKAFLDAGVPVAFGTDYPVEPITPFRGLYSAVTRMSEDGTMSYYPQSKLSRGQALAAYTTGSAYAEFAEAWKGQLLPGFVADFIVVDRDLYTVAAPAILSARVLTTYVNARPVFSDSAMLKTR